jgi:hypothetical protein
MTPKYKRESVPPSPPTVPVEGPASTGGTVPPSFEVGHTVVAGTHLFVRVSQRYPL